MSLRRSAVPSERTEDFHLRLNHCVRCWRPSSPSPTTKVIRYSWPPPRIYLAQDTRSCIADMSGNVAFVMRPWPGAMGNIGATVEIRQHPAAEGEKTGATGDAAAVGGGWWRVVAASGGYLWPASAAKIARRLGFNISPPTLSRSFL